MPLRLFLTLDLHFNNGEWRDDEDNSTITVFLRASSKASWTCSLNVASTASATLDTRRSRCGWVNRGLLVVGVGWFHGVGWFVGARLIPWCGLICGFGLIQWLVVGCAMCWGCGLLGVEAVGSWSLFGEISLWWVWVDWFSGWLWVVTLSGWWWPWGVGWFFLLGEERHTQRKRERDVSWRKKKGIINNK